MKTLSHHETNYWWWKLFFIQFVSTTPPIPLTCPTCEAEESVKDKVDDAKENKEKTRPVDAATEALLTQEPPVLMRREQLQSNFRHQVEEDEEQEPEAENPDNEEEEKDEPKATKAKAKAKSKASAKAKAKAKASAKAKAKAKASAKAKAKAKASAKAKAKAKASAKSKSKAKRDAAEKDDTEVDDEQEKKKGRTSECEVVAFDGRVKLKPKTFARRYAPQDGLPLLRFQAIEETYMADVAPKVNKQSAFQDCVG